MLEDMTIGGLGGSERVVSAIDEFCFRNIDLGN